MFHIDSLTSGLIIIRNPRNVCSYTFNDHESQNTMKFVFKKIFGFKVFVDSSFKGQLNLRKGVLLTVVVNNPAVTRADDSL